MVPQGNDLTSDSECVTEAVDAKVCFFGDFDPDYPREAVVRRALRRAGATVFECNCAIKHSAKGRGGGLLYVPRAYRALLLRSSQYRDRITHFYVPHNNHTIVPLAWLLARKNGAAVIVDAFDPAFQIALLHGRGEMEARLRSWTERVALSMADRVLVTTDEFRVLYTEMHGLNPARIRVIPPGADEMKFRARDRLGLRDDGFSVLYWGRFHRHHGVRTIIQAAELLTGHDGIRFDLVGDGLEADGARRLASELNLGNVRFHGFTGDEELVDSIERADVCLGLLSQHVCAQCSITNKVSEALAMGKAVITAESPATKRVFSHRQHAYLVQPENPRALAEAILELQADEQLRERLGREGKQLYTDQLSEQAIARLLARVLATT